VEEFGYWKLELAARVMLSVLKAVCKDWRQRFRMDLSSCSWPFALIAYCDATEPWQLGFQDAATLMMQKIIECA